MKAQSNISSASKFGDRLRTRRKDLGLTQEDVAGVIGANRRVIGQLENGKPTVELRIALAAANAVCLDVRLEFRSDG